MRLLFIALLLLSILSCKKEDDRPALVTEIDLTESYVLETAEAAPYWCLAGGECPAYPYDLAPAVGGAVTFAPLLDISANDTENEWWEMTVPGGLFLWTVDGDINGTAAKLRFTVPRADDPADGQLSIKQRNTGEFPAHTLADHIKVTDGRLEVTFDLSANNVVYAYKLALTK